MTEKRFQYNVNKNTIEENGEFVAYLNSVDGFRIANKLTALAKENEQLKTQLQNTSNQRDEFHRGARENANKVGQLEKENKELQERNNRQCKQLDDLCRLIEEKDWRALSDIMDDFKKSDELLQKEWGDYDE